MFNSYKFPTNFCFVGWNNKKDFFRKIEKNKILTYQVTNIKLLLWSQRNSVCVISVLCASSTLPAWIKVKRKKPQQPPLMGVVPGNPRGATWPPWIMHQTRGDGGRVSDGRRVPPKAPSLYKSPLMGRKTGFGGSGCVARAHRAHRGASVYMPFRPKQMQGPSPEHFASVLEQTNK